MNYLPALLSNNANLDQVLVLRLGSDGVEPHALMASLCNPAFDPFRGKGPLQVVYSCSIDFVIAPSHSVRSGVVSSEFHVELDSFRSSDE